MNKKTGVTIFFLICILFTGVYFYYNGQFMVDYPSSTKLYDPENKYPEKQQEVQNISYFNNGLEQGALDAKCNSWLCAYSIVIRRSGIRGNGRSGYWRGSIVTPFWGLRISGHQLTTEEKSYYNSGYIKGYTNICPKFRSDCEIKINAMLADYQKYFGTTLHDVSNEPIQQLIK